VETLSTVTSAHLLRKKPNAGEAAAPAAAGGGAADAPAAALEGVSLSLKHERRTTYALTNNDGSRRVPLLYVDHAASSAEGGYRISTSERCVKATPSQSFARYAFALAPLASDTFTVAEDVATTTRVCGAARVRAFLQDQAPALERAGLLPAAHVAALAALAGRASLEQACAAARQACAERDPDGTARALAGAVAAWRKLPGPDGAAAAEMWAALVGSADGWLAKHEARKVVKQAVERHRTHAAALTNSQARLRENIKVCLLGPLLRFFFGVGRSIARWTRAVHTHAYPAFPSLRRWRRCPSRS
jgi:hypothetical protein